MTKRPVQPGGKPPQKRAGRPRSESSAPTKPDPFGEKLKNLRLARGMTQERLEELSGISQSHLSRMERGEMGPSVKTIKKLAKALNVDLSVLLI